MSDENPETREAKEKGIEKGGPSKEEQAPPPGGWAKRGDDETNPRDPDTGKSD